MSALVDNSIQTVSTVDYRYRWPLERAVGINHSTPKINKKREQPEILKANFFCASSLATLAGWRPYSPRSCCCFPNAQLISTFRRVRFSTFQRALHFGFGGLFAFWGSASAEWMILCCMRSALDGNCCHCFSCVWNRMFAISLTQR